MISAVIFDVGGVLVRTPDRQSRRIMEQKLGLADWESEKIVFGGEMGTRAQIGEITNQELWNWVGKRLNLNQDELFEFRRAFWAGDILDVSLVDYIRSLRPRYLTAIISNATDALRQELSEKYLIADGFDLIVCSAEEHLMKPDAEIYRRTLNRLGVLPQEAVFIDDNRANIESAQAMGISAIQFYPQSDIPAELAKLGVVGGES